MLKGDHGATGNSAGRLDGLQGLRFVAALLVVVMHGTESLHARGARLSGWDTGSFGVDIFFVISGFVMALTAPKASGPIGERLSAAVEFMRRRIVRVVPLYWLYTATKLLLLMIVPAAALRTVLDPGHIVSSFLFVPARDASSLIMPFMPVGWTLNYEMFFYLVFAVAIALAAPRVVFCVAVFLGFGVLGQVFPDVTILQFYGNYLVFEFVMGMVIAHLWWRGIKLPTWVAVGAVVLGAYLVLGYGLPAGSVRFLTWGGCAALMVYGVVSLESRLRAFRFLPQLKFLGDSSYSLYLSHTFVVPMTAGIFAAHLSASVAIILMVSLATLAGCLSYVLLEKPLTRFFKYRFTGHKQSRDAVG